MVARGSPKTRQRRAKGEGAIYQRPDGRWVGELLHGWENGERKRKQVYGRTRPEVVAKLDRERRAHAQGEPLTPERLTVAVFLLDWVDQTLLSHKERTVLDQAQAWQFLQAAQGDRLEALWVLLLTTGLRIGEATALEWPDLNLERGELVVRRVLKTRTSERRLDLTTRTVEALRVHKVRQLELRLRLGADWSAGDRVFTTADGRPLRATTVQGHYLPRFLLRAGLPALTPHALRRTCATLLLSNGADLSAVAQQLGHADGSMTLRAYRAVLPHEGKRLAAQLESILTPPTDGAEDAGSGA